MNREPLPGRALEQLPRRPLPPFPGWWLALGPGIVWMALAQGSGELIWWPYLVAKYGLTFLCLLVPACLLQYPLNVEIGRYTLLTGESIFHGFFRVSRLLGLGLWVLMTLSFLWFGAFAAAGGTALAALTGLPEGWSARGQALFWGYLSIGLFLLALVCSRVAYVLVERVMKLVAVVTVAGLLWACAQPQVYGELPAFARGLLGPPGPLPRPWEDADATKLLTAIAFAGLGGFWILFYSYWLREKGSGMATHVGRITGPLAGRDEPVAAEGYLPREDAEGAARWRQWWRYLRVDATVGIAGNLLTTLMTCLLAWALLHPRGLLPQDYDIAVVQAEFFAVSWGQAGRMAFLLVAAAFLADTWLATLDAVSRMQADIARSLFPDSPWSMRRWYWTVVAVLSVVTCLTMLAETPGALIQLSAVIGFAGTVIFPVALYRLNFKLLDPTLPAWARRPRRAALPLALCFVLYLALALGYLWLLLRP